MLQLSQNATTAIRSLVDSPDLAEVSGVRLAGEQGGLSVSTATLPQEGDQVVEEQGARVYLEPDVADMLDDKVLDATVDDQGRISFQIGTQYPQ